MANTLTNLTPDLYTALDVISRELVGMIPAVSRDSGVGRAAKDQIVRSIVAPAVATQNIAYGQLQADDGDQTIGNKTITISKHKYVPIRWNGEEQRAMNTGPGYRSILGYQFEQAMRALCNEVEADLTGLYAKASRAVRPAGTNLFDAANYKDLAAVMKELNISGAPVDDRHIVLSNVAAGRFRGNANYVGANTAGQVDMLRQGVLLDHFGMSIRESNQIKQHTAGTGSGYLINNGPGYAVGDVALTVDTGTGTLLAGDIIGIGNYEYVVQTALAANVVTIAAPGLREAVANNAEITLRTDAERNMAFSRNAIHLVTRVPSRPEESDLAEDVMIVQDPRSGLAFEVSVYKEYRRIKYEVALAWGYEMIKPEHCILLVD
jgi:hypothetical protein